MRKCCSNNELSEVHADPNQAVSTPSVEMPMDIPQPFQEGAYVEITDSSNISVSASLWHCRVGLVNLHGWVVQHDTEDGNACAAHFTGAVNVHIFAYGQCVLVPHTALSPISIQAYRISLKDLTLSYRSRSPSALTDSYSSFATTLVERDMVQIVALESFRLAAIEDTHMDAMQAAHHTVRLRETLRSLNDDRWGSWMFRPRSANLPTHIRQYMPPMSG